MDKDKIGKQIKDQPKMAVGLLVILVFVSIILSQGWSGFKDSLDVPQNSDSVIIAGALNFTDASTGEVVSATLSDSANKVTFTSKGTGKVTLDRVTSASGSKYANKDESIVFWERNGEVIIVKDEEPVFNGRLTR